MEAKTERKPVMSKAQFLSLLVPAMKARGVVFIENGKKVQSREKYWELYRCIKQAEIAITAAAGMDVSLSGIGALKFTEVGRDPEARYQRFKYRPSSSIVKVFKEDTGLVSKEPAADDVELQNRFNAVMQALGASVEEPAPTIIEVGDEGEVPTDGDAETEDEDLV